MPGTPPTSPRHGAPRYAQTDPATFASQVNAITDAFDASAPRLTTGLYSARPAAAIQGRLYYATDTGHTWYDTGSAWSPVGPSFAVPVSFSYWHDLTALMPTPSRIPGSWVPVYPGSAVSLYQVKYVVDRGACVITLTKNEIDIPMIGGTLLGVGTLQAAQAPVGGSVPLADGDFLRPVIQSHSTSDVRFLQVTAMLLVTPTA